MSQPDPAAGAPAQPTVNLSVLHSLLARWAEAREQGRPIAVEELADDPAMRAELKRRIEMEDVHRAGSVTATRTHGRPPKRLLDDAALPTVAGYEMVGPLGDGGMGVVYQARDLKLNRIVALKMVLPTHRISADRLARFVTEAEAVARLQHPHIVQIFERGEHDGHPYFTLEYCPGGTLEDLAGEGPVSPRAAAELVAKLAGAVAAAHSVGIVHRDLKPQNVLLSADGTPKVSDFGLAKRIDVSEGSTVAGDVFGSPGYMAPEQAAGRTDAVGAPADIWGLGAVLYRLVAGEPPFRGASALDTIQLTIDADVISPRAKNAAVPRDLETIILKCLEKEPARRYSSAQALADDLNRFLLGHPILARRTGTGRKAVLWVRRNPALGTGVAIAVAALVAGTTISLIQAARARDHAHQAELAETDAKERATAEETARRRANRLLANSLVVLAAADWDRNECRLARERLAQVPPEERRWEWYYLKRKFEAGQFTIGPVGSPLNGVAASPDGRWIAAVGEDGKVRIWDAVGNPHAEWAAHKGAATCVGFTPDSRSMVTGGADGVVRVWGLDRGTVRKEIQCSDAVNAVLVTAGGTPTLIVGAADGSVWAANIESGRILRRLRWGGVITSVAPLPDGERVAVGRDDREGRAWVALWDPRSGAMEEPPDLEPSSDLTFVAVSPSGNWSVAVGNGFRFYEKYFRPTDNRTSPDPQAGSGTTCLAISPDGRQAAIGSIDRTVRVVSLGSGWNPPRHGHEGAIRAVAFTPDGRRILSGGDDGTVRVWTATLDPRQVEFAQLVPTASRNTFSFVRGHRTDIPQTLRVRAGSIDRPHSLANVAYGPRLDVVAAESDWHRWRVIATDTVSLLGELPLGDLTPGPDWVFSPSGRMLAIPDHDRRGASVRLWDTRSGNVVGAIPGAWLRAALEPKDLPALRASVQLVSPEATGALWGALGRTQLVSPPVAAVAFSPNESVVAAATLIGFILSDGSATRIIDVPPPLRLGEVAHGVVFSPDGTHLAATGGDWVAVLDVRSGTWSPLVQTLASAEAVCFLDADRIAIGDREGVTRVWDWSSATPLSEFKGHACKVLRVASDPTGDRLFTGGEDGIVRVWDTETGQPVAELKAHSGRVTDLFVGSDQQLRTADREAVQSLPVLWDAPAAWTPEDERRSRAAVVRPDPRWHRLQAAALEQASDWFAAAFHYRQAGRAEMANTWAAIASFAKAESCLTQHRIERGPAPRIVPP